MPNDEAARAKRLARLTEAWQVLHSSYCDAERWNDSQRMAGYKTAMKILDAVIAITEQFTATRDRFGNVIEDFDAQLVERLSEVAWMRDVFGEQKKPKPELPADPPAQADNVITVLRATDLFEGEEKDGP